VKLGCCGCHDPAANGWYHQPRQGGGGDDIDDDEEEEEQHQEEEVPGLLEIPELVAGLQPLISLAHSLTLQGPGSWWEEAREHYPLLLVQTVLAALKVRRMAVQVGAWSVQGCR
jgi:hypothetical protein